MVPSWVFALLLSSVLLSHSNQNIVASSLWWSLFVWGGWVEEILFDYLATNIRSWYIFKLPMWFHCAAKFENHCFSTLLTVWSRELTVIISITWDLIMNAEYQAHSQSTYLKPTFNKIFKWLICILKFEKHSFCSWGNSEIKGLLRVTILAREARTRIQVSWIPNLCYFLTLDVGVWYSSCRKKKVCINCQQDVYF